VELLVVHFSSFSIKQSIYWKVGYGFRFLAESFRMPVVVTNQVRAEIGFGGKDVTFTDKAKSSVMTNAGIPDGPEHQLTAALGTKWAHSVNIRLIMESISGAKIFSHWVVHILTG
jgi:RAD51-like protein 1